MERKDGSKEGRKGIRPWMDIKGWMAIPRYALSRLAALDF